MVHTWENVFICRKCENDFDGDGVDDSEDVSLKNFTKKTIFLEEASNFEIIRLIQPLIVGSRSVLKTRKSPKPASRVSRRWTSVPRKTSQ